MSAALYIVVESPAPGFDTTVNGKALSRNGEAVEATAKALGVAPLMKFFSMSVAELEVAAEEFEIPADIERAAQPETWFEADAGLQTVLALLNHLDGNPDALGKGVREDLLEFERVLREAKRRGLRWHLGIDY